jgi:hypothetical protein
MKIVLADPGFGPDSFNTFWDSHWSAIVNHGLCAVSAFAKSKGYDDISLLDVRRLKDRIA